MRKIVCMLLLVVLAMVGLTACGSEFTAEVDTIYVEKDGVIKGANVSSFDKAYYDENELKDFIESAVDDFVKSNGKGAIELTSFAVEDGKASAFFDYYCAEDYKKFNGISDFFEGTTVEAAAEGYSLSEVNLIKSSYASDKQELTDDAHVVVVSQDINIKVKGTVIFVSENVDVISEDECHVNYDYLDEEAPIGYVVYK